MRWLLLFLFAFLGCRDEQFHYTATPARHALAWQNIESVPGWYSAEQIGAQLDGAVDAAVVYLGRYGVEEARTRAVAHAHRYVGFDMPRFKAGASPTGWASGAYYEGGRQIVLAFWSRARGDVVPAEAPQWTVYSWPTRPSPKYDWGTTPHFPALGHEIGHAIYGPTFEHTWVPPVVNGRLSLEASQELFAYWQEHCELNP